MWIPGDSNAGCYNPTIGCTNDRAPKYDDITIRCKDGREYAPNYQGICRKCSGDMKEHAIKRVQRS